MTFSSPITKSRFRVSGFEFSRFRQNLKPETERETAASNNRASASASRRARSPNPARPSNHVDQTRREQRDENDHLEKIRLASPYCGDESVRTPPPTDQKDDVNIEQMKIIAMR